MLKLGRRDRNRALKGASHAWKRVRGLADRTAHQLQHQTKSLKTAGRRAKAHKAADQKAARKIRSTPRHRGLASAARLGSVAPRGRLEAIGWFLLAGVILAWPRSQSPFDWSFLRKGAAAAVIDPSTEVAAADLAEPGRGRAAHSPREIPLRGWKDIFWRTWREFNRDNIPQVAGGVAFFGLLAVFPAMAAFVSLYGLFFDVPTAYAQLNVLSGVVPAAALQLVGEQMIRLAAARHTGLGFAFAISLLLSVWSANAGVKALIVGLNVAFEEREKRNLLKLNLVSLGFTVGLILFLILALGAVVAVPIVLAFIGYKGAALAVLRWPLMLGVAMLGLAALYRFGPSRDSGRWRWVSWGSGFAAVLWLTASLLFSFYVAHFGSYDKTYGSLGAVVGFMTWIWLSTITVLVGAELNSEMEHQTAVDTTTGAPKPMGQRGARVADTLGEPRPPKGVAAPPPAPAPGRGAAQPAA
jgi:membrane protein